MPFYSFKVYKLKNDIYSIIILNEQNNQKYFEFLNDLSAIRYFVKKSIKLKQYQEFIITLKANNVSGEKLIANWTTL